MDENSGRCGEAIRNVNPAIRPALGGGRLANKARRALLDRATLLFLRARRRLRELAGRDRLLMGMHRRSRPILEPSR